MTGRSITTGASLALAAAGIALVAWTLYFYPPLSAGLVVASLVLAGSSLWSSQVLFGSRTAWIFFGIAVACGWFAEQMGSTRGWFFGDYTYTDVLGPRLGAVPVVIPMMWFGLCHIGLVMASLVLWRQPVPVECGFRTAVLAAVASAMIVTAFDLGADPYFVYVLKAWVMQDTHGKWFGETVRGFDGWMLVSFTIVALAMAIARPAAGSAPLQQARWAALVPVGVYACFIVFQVSLTQPDALRVIAFFAMGIPALIAANAWAQWSRRPQEILA